MNKPTPRTLFASAVLAVLLIVGGPRAVDAADPPPASPYVDMGAMYVQFDKDGCDYNMLTLDYQLALFDAADAPRVEAWSPKVRSALFFALYDHLEDVKDVRLKAVRSVLLKAAQDVLGKDAVQDVLIMRTATTCT